MKSVIDFRRMAFRSFTNFLLASGSTGKPKGVLLSHLAVTQSLLAHDAEIPQYSRFLQFASPTFDVSMFEIFFTFFRGSTLIACERAKLLDDLVGVMNEMRVDAAELTPTVAGSLLCTREAVPGLRVLLTIGEMLTKAVVEEFGATDDMDSMLYGMYGPTECVCIPTQNLSLPNQILTPRSSIIRPYIVLYRLLSRQMAK